jgi:hypothetical protein
MALEKAFTRTIGGKGEQRQAKHQEDEEIATAKRLIVESANVMVNSRLMRWKGMAL